MTLIRGIGEHRNLVSALVVALLLHIPLLWLIGQPESDLPSPAEDFPVFHLEPLETQVVQKPSPRVRDASKEVQKPDSPRETMPRPLEPVSEPPKSESKAPSKRPDLSAGLLSQQISEVSEHLVRQKNAAAQGKRIIYAQDAKGHSATLGAYEEAWRSKVEHIGNLNYPEAAKAQGVSGTLTVAVAINPDGSLFSVRVLKSSGNPVIDEGAIRIVRLSAPFAPLPVDLLSDIDVLVITRTWRFDDQARFSSE